MRAEHVTHFEKLGIQSIADRIETGFALARLAAVELSEGRADRTREVLAHAEEGCTEIERRLEQAASVGWNISGLGHELRKLRARLKALDREAGHTP